MTFYLLSEGLACAGAFTAAYESLKALSSGSKGLDKSRLSAILEFWIVLAAMNILEEYVEFLISWFPFYYLFKCLLLGLMLSPQSKIPHVLYESFVQPAVATIKQEADTRVVPLVESFVIRHGHWFNKKLLTRSLELFDDDELLSLECDLERKLADVREEIQTRQNKSEPNQSE